MSYTQRREECSHLELKSEVEGVSQTLGLPVQVARQEEYRAPHHPLCHVGHVPSTHVRSRVVTSPLMLPYL